MDPARGCGWRVSSLNEIVVLGMERRLWSHRTRSAVRFEFCARGAADTRVPVSQNREISQKSRNIPPKTGKPCIAPARTWGRPNLTGRLVRYGDLLSSPGPSAQAA